MYSVGSVCRCCCSLSSSSSACAVLAVFLCDLSSLVDVLLELLIADLGRDFLVGGLHRSEHSEAEEQRAEHSREQQRTARQSPRGHSDPDRGDRGWNARRHVDYALCTAMHQPIRSALRLPLPLPLLSLLCCSVPAQSRCQEWRTGRRAQRTLHCALPLTTMAERRGAAVVVLCCGGDRSEERDATWQRGLRSRSSRRSVTVHSGAHAVNSLNRGFHLCACQNHARLLRSARFKRRGTSGQKTRSRCVGPAHSGWNRAPHYTPLIALHEARL